MVLPGLINLDFADVRTVMTEMGKAMMGTGEASGEDRALMAAQNAIQNPLLDEVSLKGAKAVLVNVTGGPDMTLLEVDEACNAIAAEVDPDANTIFGAAFDDSLAGKIRVSVVATGMDGAIIGQIEARPLRTLVAAARPMEAPAPAPVAEPEPQPELIAEPALLAEAEEEPAEEAAPLMKLVDPAVEEIEEEEEAFSLAIEDAPAAPKIVARTPEPEPQDELFIPARRAPPAQKGGWLSLFGGRRPEPAEDHEPTPQFRNAHAGAAELRTTSSAQPVEEAEQDDLEIPSFLRRLAN
jgi:cell division protein FtsZ